MQNSELKPAQVRVRGSLLLQRRKELAGEARQGVVARAHDDDAVSAAIWIGIQNETFDRTEYSCRRTNAEPKRHNRSDSEARIPYQRDERILQVLPKVIQEVQAAFVSTLLLKMCEIPDGLQRRQTSFLGRHPMFDILVSLPEQMFLKFPLKLVVYATRPE